MSARAKAGDRRKVAFLFPGQGAKRADAALRACVRTKGGLARCEMAARAAGVSLGHVVQRPSLLDHTEIYQPMITAVALSAVDALREAGVAPEVVLGHSMGEVAAWAAAGGVSAEDAIELAALRGRLMAREAARHPGGMVALGTGEQHVIDGALAAGLAAGRVCVAAWNAPEEVVLSGDEAAIRAVMAFAPGMATRVPTGGAWHSPAMEGALREWTEALACAPRSRLEHTFVANRTGEAVSCDDEVVVFLGEQLVRPVRWARALATAGELAFAFVTLGPGAVLRSSVHKNLRAETLGLARLEIFSTEDPRSLAGTVASLGRGATSPPLTPTPTP